MFTAKVLIEQWRVHFNTVRPHSFLGYRSPALEVLLFGNANAAQLSRSDRVTSTARYNAALTFCLDHAMGAGQRVLVGGDRDAISKAPFFSDISADPIPATSHLDVCSYWGTVAHLGLGHG